MIEFFFTSPMSRISPIMLIMFSVSPVSQSVTNAPVTYGVLPFGV